MTPEAEHPSLSDWLASSLTAEERQNIGLISLNQWPFFCAVVGEIALTAHSMGLDVTVGMWADDTPLHDPGWTTSRRIARMTGSRSIDDNLERILVQQGLPPESIARPPIRRWKARDLPNIPDPITRSEIRALRYHGSSMGRSILQVHPDNNTPIRDSHHWPRRYTERAVKSYAWVYDQVSELIHQRGITTVVVYNGRFTHDQAAAAAAQAAGARVLYYDAGGLDTGFDLTFATTHDWVDLQHRMSRLWENWSPDERVEIGSTWFVNRQEHKEPGVRLFVEFQERGNLQGVPKAAPLVAFFSSSPDEIAELELDWDEYFGSQPGALAALADAVRATPGAQLVVRTHPHMRLKPTDDLTDWRKAVEEAEPAAHFDASDPLDSYALMREADIVFTYGSSSGVEAAFMGKPVVVMGPSAYDLLGCAVRARSPEEVRVLLQNPPHADSQHAMPYGLLMQRRGFSFTHCERTPHDTYLVAETELQEASELSRKISHGLAARNLKRLTAN